MNVCKICKDMVDSCIVGIIIGVAIIIITAIRMMVLGVIASAFLKIVEIIQKLTKKVLNCCK